MDTICPMFLLVFKISLGKLFTDHCGQNEVVTLVVIKSYLPLQSRQTRYQNGPWSERKVPV